jgi:DNA-binding GntR family transcriptional regulator
VSDLVARDEIIGQLQAVYAALEARDAEKTGRLMENHVQYFVEKIKGQLL